MTGFTITAEAANLEALQARRKHSEEVEITIGDLHGNALKLFHFLVCEGVFQVSKSLYEEFVAIYNSSTKLNDAAFQRTKVILSRLKVNKVKIVRLLGDEVFDRGNNDFLTLLILNKLKESNVPFEIMLSNHGFGFLMYETGRRNIRNVIPAQRASYINMDSFLNKSL